MERRNEMHRNRDVVNFTTFLRVFFFAWRGDLVDAGGGRAGDWKIGWILREFVV